MASPPLKDEEVVKEKTSKEIRRFHGRLMRWVVESSVSNAILMILMWSTIFEMQTCQMSMSILHHLNLGWSNIAAVGIGGSCLQDALYLIHNDIALFSFRVHVRFFAGNARPAVTFSLFKDDEGFIVV